MMNELTHDVVLKMLSNTRKFEYHINTSSRQYILRSNTAVHENVWTTDSTTSKNDFLIHSHGLSGRRTRSRKLNASCSDCRRIARVKYNTGDSCIRKHVEVGTWRKRIDVSRSRVRTGEIRRVDGIESNKAAPIVTAVRIGRYREVGCLKSLRPVASNWELTVWCV